jgi:hypothetical protein
MYGKFLVIIILVIAFTATIAGTTTTVVGQNQTINLTELFTPDTDTDKAHRLYIEYNVFAPGETIVLYVEPVGFAHEQIIDEKGGGNNNTMLYLMNMTADYEIAAANGTEFQLIEDVQVGNITSHRPNTEMFLTLTLAQEVQPLPIGSYVITYSVTDEVSGESFQLEKEITVAERE